MSRYLVMALVILTAPAASAADEIKPVEIPLKEVWALNMPGTRNLRELDSPDVEKSILSKATRQILASWPDDDRGMAVEGEGLDAVAEFHRIREKKLRRNELSTDSPLSLVFYTAGVGLHTHIERIEKLGNDFTIQYRFTPPPSNRGINQYLAVIPIGKVSPGKYEVKIEELPLEKKWVELGYEKILPRHRKNVCKSFNFTVTDRRPKP